MNSHVIGITGLAIIAAVGYILLLIYLIFFYSKGKAGEKAVARRLKRLPAKEYKVINDLMLPTQYGTTQIDHVVVSRYGVFVIETKNYQGYIYGSENAEHWTQNIWGNKYSMPNPIRQNNIHVKAIGYQLKKLNIDTNIHSIIAFAYRCNISVTHSADTEIVYFHKLLPEIRKYQNLLITHETVERIVKHLEEINIVDKAARKNHNARVYLNQLERQQKIEEGICPRCGGSLVYKNGMYGPFLGCSNYPNCKFTQKIEY